MRGWVVGVVVGSGLACASGEPAPAPEPAPVAAPEPEERGGKAKRKARGDDDGDEGSPLPKLGPDPGSGPDCLLRVAELEPELSPKQPGASQPARFKRGEGRVVERVRYDDGAELRIVRQGCAHFVSIWEYAPVGKGDVVAQAREHFAPELRAEGDPVPRMCLAFEGATEHPSSFACGEATGELVREGDVLRFTYNFAM